MTATVQISKSAIFEMIMASLEAYAVKHEGKHVVSIETVAHLWGSVNKKGPFKCNIDHVSVETSAKRLKGSVERIVMSLEIKKDLAAIFGEGYNYIGSFHTHPWTKNESLGRGDRVTGPSSIRNGKLYRLSGGDHRAEIGSPEIEIGEKKYSVALVMTVFAMERANDQKDTIIDSHIIEFSLGNVKLWLKAQVFEHLEQEEMGEAEVQAFESLDLCYEHYTKIGLLPIPIHTTLDCDFNFSILAKFGRISVNSRKGKYQTADVSEKRWLYSLNS